MKYLNKKTIGIMVILVAAFVVVWLVPQLRDGSAASDLLEAVNVSKDIDFHSMVHADWIDQTGYKSGYEVIVLDVDPDEWTMPEGWNEGAMSLRTLDNENELHIRDLSGISKLDLYDMYADYPQWFFERYDAGTEEYPDKGFHIGLYGDGVLIVYRGSNLKPEWTEIYTVE